MTIKGGKDINPQELGAFYEKKMGKQERRRHAMIAIFFIIINFVSLQKIISLFC